MANSVLITGASGLIGSRLTELLLQKGYRVVHLGRSKRSDEVPSFVWDVEYKKIDLASLEGVTTIVHLAGAGVADKRWSTARKNEILNSRTNSCQLLFDTLKNHSHTVHTVVAASAIGYYGFSRDSTLFSETDEPGNDYLASVVVAWENESGKIASLGIRVPKIRIGIVLSEKGGALKEMALPVTWGLGAALGSGKQMMSWIHLDDLCLLFIQAIENNAMEGPYNAVAPHPVTNLELTNTIAKVLHRPLWLPPIPGVVMKLLVGEMAEIVVNGSRISSEKVQRSGFKFLFPDLEGALKDLLTK